MRPTLIVLALIALVVGGVQAWHALQSPEDLIQGKLDDAVEAFNDTHLGPCMELFSPDFAETPHGYTKEDVKSGIVSAFFSEVDPETKAFLYRVSISEVEIEAGEDGADASLLVRLMQRRGDDWELAWNFRLEGRLVEEDRGGWQFLRAAVETVDGRRPR